MWECNIDWLTFCMLNYRGLSLQPRHVSLTGNETGKFLLHETIPSQLSHTTMVNIYFWNANYLPRVGVVAMVGCVCVGDGNPGRGNNIYKSRGMPRRIAEDALWLEHKLRLWYYGQLIQQCLMKRSKNTVWGIWSIFQRQCGYQHESDCDLCENKGQFVFSNVPQFLALRS